MKHLIIILLLGLPAVLVAAEDKNAPKPSLSLQLDAPATNYALEIREVREVRGENWIHAVVVKRGDLGGGAITTIKDAIPVPKGCDRGKKTRWFISGKTWNWGKAPAKAVFIKTPKVTEPGWSGGRSLWKRPKS